MKLKRTEHSQKGAAPVLIGDALVDLTSNRRDSRAFTRLLLGMRVRG